MNNSSIYDGINAAYGVAMEESGPSLPALQATSYQPRMGEKIGLCLSEESFDMLSPDSPMAGLCEAVVVNYGADDLTMFALPSGCRWVVLGVPRLYLLNRETGEIGYPQRGERLAGTRKVTITRLTLAMLLPDGELLLDGDGLPQLFTLKLKSNKTCLVTGDKRDPDFKSLADLNKALQAHFGRRGVSLTHLVSVALVATPKKFTSSLSGETSMGVMFTLQGGAKPLSEAQQLMMFELLKDPEILGLIQDPFRLKKQSEEATNQPMSINPDDIDF